MFHKKKNLDNVSEVCPIISFTILDIALLFSGKIEDVEAIICIFIIDWQKKINTLN